MFGIAGLYVLYKTYPNKSISVAMAMLGIGVVMTALCFEKKGELIGRGNPLPFEDLIQDKTYDVVGSIPELKLLLVKKDGQKGIKCISDFPKELKSGTTFLVKDVEYFGQALTTVPKEEETKKQAGRFT